MSQYFGSCSTLVKNAPMCQNSRNVNFCCCPQNIPCVVGVGVCSEGKLGNQVTAPSKTHMATKLCLSLQMVEVVMSQ